MDGDNGQIDSKILGRFFFFKAPFRAQVSYKTIHGETRYHIELETSENNMAASTFVQCARAVTKNKFLAAANTKINHQYTCFTVDLSAAEYQLLLNHDKQLEKAPSFESRQITARNLCQKHSDVKTSDAIHTGYLNYLAGQYKNSTGPLSSHFKKVADRLERISTCTSERKIKHINKELVVSEVRSALSLTSTNTIDNDSDEATVFQKIHHEINDNSFKIPDKFVLAYPIHRAERLLTDHKNGHKNNGSKNTFNHAELESLLKFTDDPAEKLKFIEILFHMIHEKNRPAYTYSGMWQNSKRTPLTSTQQEHTCLLKSKFVEILKQHKKKPAVTAVVTAILNKKEFDNIIDTNTSNWFLLRRSETGTRKAVNEILNSSLSATPTYYKG